MHDGAPPGRRAPQADGGAAETATDLDALARDWITVWQSEAGGAAIDREVQETWQIAAAHWAGAAQAMLRAVSHGADGGGRKPSGTAATARPAPAAAAPDARDAEIDRLTDRIADLERRLAALERRS